MTRPVVTAALCATLSLGVAGCEAGLGRPLRPVPAFSTRKSTPYTPAVVHFHDRSRHHPTSWRWSFGDGTTSRARNPVHRYASPGTYAVSLRVTNASGSATRSGRLRLEPAPRTTPRVSFTATPATGTAPVSVDFHDGSTGFPTAWVWDFGDGSRSTQQHPTHVYRTPGRYDVRLTATNLRGTATRTERRLVTVTRTDPVLVGAGDIADCRDDEDERTAALVARVRGTVFTLGDEAYPSGTRRDFAKCYAPTWGRFRSRTLPVTGNHEYQTGDASAHFRYFGARAGKPGRGYRSLDIGAWHVVLLNSNCAYVGCGPGSAQISWLARDLEASRARCTLALWHHPRFSSGTHSDNPATAQFWEYLYYAGAELVLNGHDHDYERFGPQDPSGRAEPTYGLTEIIAGTGGKELRHIGRPDANSLVRDQDAFGVLRLTLRNTSADWRFLPVEGETFTDSGTVHCHDRPPAPPAPRVGLSTSDPAGAAPLAVAFTDRSHGDPSAWDWDFGDGTRGTSMNPVHTYDHPGTYTVRLTVSNPTGSDSLTLPRYVSVGAELPAGDYARMVLAGRPVGYWRLGESAAGARDATGAGAGRVVGGVRRLPRGVTRDLDGALLLDGRTGSVEVTDHDDLDVGSDDFSLEAWARPASVHGVQGHVVVQKSTGGDFSGWQYRLALTREHRWRGTVFVGAGRVAVTARRSARAAWTHLVLVRSDDRLLLYVDGALAAHARLLRRVNDGRGAFAIGRAGDSPLDWFDGAVDEVALYRSALSSAEVSAHYRSTRTR